MILCGDKMVGKGEREGVGAGEPPGKTPGGGRKLRSGNKKHSYVKISDTS